MLNAILLGFRLIILALTTAQQSKRGTENDDLRFNHSHSIRRIKENDCEGKSFRGLNADNELLPDEASAKWQ